MRRRRKSRPARRSGRQQTQRDVDGGDQTREAGDGGRVASRIRLGARETRDGGWEPKPVAASMRSTGGAAASSAFASSAADAEVSEGAPASKEEVVERMTALFGSEAVEQLQSGDWKRRLAGLGVAAEAVRAMSPAEADDAREVVTRGLAVVPGFDDKNFQVLGRVFEILGALADKAAGFSKPDGARVVSGAAQKVADVKLRGPATAALMSVTEALGPKFVVAQLHKHTATHKNPKVTAEALLFCASTVGRVRRGDARRRVQHLVVQIVPRRVQSRVQIRRGQVFGGDARGTRSGASGFPVRPEGHADEKPGRGIRA